MVLLSRLTFHPANTESVFYYSQGHPLTVHLHNFYLLLVPPKPEAVCVPEEDVEPPAGGRLLLL